MSRTGLILLLLFLFADTALGEGLDGLALIKDLKVLSNDGEIRAVFKTKGYIERLPAVKVVKDGLLQLDIEKSYTDPPKRTFHIGDSYLEKVALYQMDGNIVRVRLHVLGPYRDKSGKVWREKDGDGFVLSLKKGQAAALQESPDITAAFPSIFGRAAEEAKETHRSEVKEEKTNPIIKVTASFALVLGLFLVGAYLYREKVLKKGASGKGKLITVLDRGFIDMKKGIVIVDVAGEVLVLGTTADSITMLTKLDGNSAIERARPANEGGQAATFNDSMKQAALAAGDREPEKLMDRISRLKPL